MDKVPPPGSATAPGVTHPATSSLLKQQACVPDGILPSPTVDPEKRPYKRSSASSSVSPSPATSRNTSPSRHSRRPSSTHERSSANSSRRTTQADLASLPPPSDPVTDAPASDPITPRDLASTTTPVLPPPDDQLSQASTSMPQKPASTSDARENHRWPISPRLRSPPPNLAKPGVAPTRLNELDLPAINIQRPSPLLQTVETPLLSPEMEAEDSFLQSGIRTPARAQLETVQEVSQNNSPEQAHDTKGIAQWREKLSTSSVPSGAPDVVPVLNPRTHSSSKPQNPAQQHTTTITMTDSNAAPKSEARRTASVPPPLIFSRQSSVMSAKQIKSKPEGSTQSMTVETETVPSVPQVTLATGTKSEGGGGTLKAKPSSETIKPRKEKKVPRKQLPVSSGTGTSKADIFEAKIASAVDEADTSDSDETFVYDSNPPDTTDRSTRRFHSRTPSATSMVSQADRQNLRSIYGVMEGSLCQPPGHGPVPKKSMKFVNTFNGGVSDNLTTGDEDGKGTGRSTGGSARGTVRHHHHIGRWGRQTGNGHASLFDNESPFPHAAKTKVASRNPRTSSAPNIPRNGHPHRGHLATKRSAIQMSSSYDLEDTTGADDERAPLLDPNRSHRGLRSRRQPHNLRNAESQTYARQTSYLNRFAACLVLTIMLLLVISSAIGFMFATSQPLSGIEIVSISNVTSEEVLMYDLTVKAHNPNIVVTTIDHANLEVFAKSDYAGDGNDWWWPPNLIGEERHGVDRKGGKSRSGGGGGGGDDDDARPNLLLGRILDFDSPLSFEASLFHQGRSSSAEMQLPYPANETRGGSGRWKRVYEDEFDLIIKGVVKYSLPLSAQVRSATVSGRTTVKPNSANDPARKPNDTNIDGI